MRRARGFTFAETVVTLAALGLCVGAALLALLADAPRRVNGVRCSNNLRGLALAAAQYADVHGAFPHVGPLDALQGGVESRDASRVVRALVWHGLATDPERFVCPDSYDMAVAVDPLVLDQRRWSWGGEQRDTPVSPLAEAGAADDPTLLASSELSYGWTRRGLRGTSRGATPLAADRSCGGPPGEDPSADPFPLNHQDGLFVSSTDGSVRWVWGTDAEACAALLSTADDGGALGILTPRADPEAVRGSWLVLRRAPGGGPILLGLACLPALALGLLITARRRRRLNLATAPG